MTITDFYEAIKKIVRTYPTMQLKCWQPQTFAVLPEASDLNSPNLGKVICDKNRPYFYSKLWESKGFTPNTIEFEFPLVVIYEENIVKKKEQIEKQEIKQLEKNILLLKLFDIILSSI